MLTIPFRCKVGNRNCSTNLGFHKADYLTQSLFGWYVEIKGVKGNNEK